ncbi:hypothetical protein D3C87_1676810 [compost metagenome]
MSVKIVPAGFVIRQPEAALALALFDHAGNQHIATQQEIVTLFERLCVMLVIEEGRAQHRLVICMGLPQQGVEIRQQAIAQFNRTANGRCHARIHPRLIHSVIVIP